MTFYVSVKLRRQVRRDAGGRCGYCLSAEVITGVELEIEHIIARALGGATERDNLWCACHHCNNCKNDRIEAHDPLTGQLTPLFNPRTQRWQEHFYWSFDGTIIIGLTATGRATVDALQMNNDIVVIARRFWVSVGRHPPLI